MHAFVMSATVIALSAAPVFAQTYPTQDLHFICAYPAGSGADIFVRFYAEKLRPVIGRTIIVENKPGAVSNIATEYVARTKPDGYTVYIQGASSIAANMHLFKNPPVDVGRAIQIAAPLNKQPYMLVVDASRPWKNVAELTAYLKDRKRQGELCHHQSARQGDGCDLQGARGAAGGRGAISDRVRHRQ